MLKVYDDPNEPQYGYYNEQIGIEDYYYNDMERCCRVHVVQPVTRSIECSAGFHPELIAAEDFSTINRVLCRNCKTLMKPYKGDYIREIHSEGVIYKKHFNFKVCYCEKCAKAFGRKIYERYAVPVAETIRTNGRSSVTGSIQFIKETEMSNGWIFGEKY